MFKILYVLCFFVAITILSGCGNKKQEVKDKSSLDIVVDTEVVENQSFEDAVYNFNKLYKEALLGSRSGKSEGLVDACRGAYGSWQMLVSDHAQKQPPEFKRTNDWVLSLKSIENTLEESLEAALRSERELANEKLEEARKALFDLRRENAIKNISDDMLLFEEAIDKVVVIEIKDEAAIFMADLKIKFTVLKEYNQNNSKYREMIKEIENIVGGMDSASGRAWAKEKTRLKPSFLALFKEFG